MKQILVKQKEYKIIEKELPFNVPVEPVYLFIFGIRISVKITAEWYDLRDGEQAASLKIVVVHGWPDFIVKNYTVNSYNIGDMLKNGKDELKTILTTMNTPEEREKRTADQFNADLDSAITEFKK